MIRRGAHNDLWGAIKPNQVMAECSILNGFGCRKRVHWGRPMKSKLYVSISDEAAAALVACLYFAASSMRRARQFCFALVAIMAISANERLAALPYSLGQFGNGDTTHFDIPTIFGPSEDELNFLVLVPDGTVFPDITIHFDPVPNFQSLTVQVIRDAEPPTAPTGSPSGFTFTYDDPRNISVGDTFVFYTLVVDTSVDLEPTFYTGALSIGVPLLETPLPAALPLFATGLGGLGLLGWRRRRKARRLSTQRYGAHARLARLSGSLCE